MTPDGVDTRRQWQDVPFTAGVVAVAASLLAGPVVGGFVVSPWPVVAALALAVLTQVVGRALVPWLALPASVPRWLVSVVAGYAAVSAVHLGATALLNLAVTAAFVVDLVVVALLVAVTRRGRGADAARETASVNPWRLQVAGLLLCAALSTVWARETLRALPTAEATGVFPAWQDYFLHAAEISYLRDYPAYERRSQYLTAVPQPLYHRGSFALGAVFSWLGGVSSLGTATAYWLPAGLLLTMTATMAWGAAMGGPLAGLGALAAVFLVPDASHYGAENHFLSFEWLMQMASGSGYGLALAVTALTVLVASTGTPGRSLVTAGVLVVAAALFRVHIALLASAGLAWFAVGTWRPRVTRRGAAGAIVLVLVGVVVLVWMESVSLAPHFLTGRREPGMFFLSVHTQANNLPSVFRAWWETHDVAAEVAFGFPLMLWAGLGVWVVLVPVLALAGQLRPLGAGAGLVPLALVLASLSVILLVPTPAHGDPTDWGHRSFVLVYLAFAGLAGAAVARLIAGRLDSSPAAENRQVTVAALGVVALLTVPWQLGERVQQRWVVEYATRAVPREARVAGEFVREHAGAGDQILAASEDPYAVYVALTERRGWLSRASLYQQLGPASAAAANARLDAHKALGAAPSWQALQAFGRAQGVAWYIADTPVTRAWPAEIAEQCAYCGDEMRVYALR